MGTSEAGPTTESDHGPVDADSPATTGPDTDHYPLPEDVLFDVLNNERRRATLRYLNGTDGTVEMRAIAEQVAAWEHDTTVDQLDADQRQRVYIALYQSHLETLADAGILEYDQSRGTVRLTEVGQDVASYLEGGDDATFGWQDNSLDYLAATAASSLLIGGSTTGVLGLARLSSFTVSVLTVVIFTAVTVGRIGAKVG